MFSLVTFKPNNASIRARITSIIGQDDRAFYKLPGAAFVVEVVTKVEARKVQTDLEAIRSTNANFDYAWFRINPTALGYFPKNNSDRPDWPNLAFLRGIVS